MNKIQKKINKLVKYTFDVYSCCADFGILSYYNSVRKILREEIKKRYTKSEIIKTSVEEMFNEIESD